MRRGVCSAKQQIIRKERKKGIGKTVVKQFVTDLTFKAIVYEGCRALRITYILNVYVYNKCSSSSSSCSIEDVVRHISTICGKIFRNLTAIYVFILLGTASRYVMFSNIIMKFLKQNVCRLRMYTSYTYECFQLNVKSNPFTQFDNVVYN